MFDFAPVEMSENLCCLLQRDPGQPWQVLMHHVSCRSGQEKEEKGTLICRYHTAVLRFFFFFIRVQTSSLPSTSVSEKIILKSKHLFGLAILVQLYK